MDLAPFSTSLGFRKLGTLRNVQMENKGGEGKVLGKSPSCWVVPQILNDLKCPNNSKNITLTPNSLPIPSHTFSFDFLSSLPLYKHTYNLCILNNYKAETYTFLSFFILQVQIPKTLMVQTKSDTKGPRYFILLLAKITGDK